MASTKIRGITIELGADTSGLSKALKGVNTEIKSTQKQLKDVERLLKLDPTNTELLQQKQRLLANQVDQTKTKLDALKEAQKQVGEELEKTGKGQEQYDALEREIAQTERELKEAEAAARNFNATTEKVSAAAGKLSQKFGTVAQKTKRLSQLAGGLLASMGALAIKTAQEADELATLSKQTGISTDELQKMKYAADLIDVDTDTIVGGMKKLKKQLESTNSPLEELGVKTKDAKGEFRDITDIFYDTVKALSEIPNETERDVKSMEIFGKSADELAGVIDDGGEALRRLGEEAENLGVIIPEEDIAKANELNDAIDQLKAEATGVFAQLGTEIAEMLLPHLPEIKEGLEAILQGFRDLDPDTLGLAAKVAGIVAILAPLATALSGISTAISAIVSWGGKLAGFLGTVQGAFAAVTAAVVAFVALIAGNIALFAVYLEQMREAWFTVTDNMYQKIVEFGESVGESIGFLKNTIVAWFNGIAEIARSFMYIIEGIFQTLGALVTGQWSKMWAQRWYSPRGTNTANCILWRFSLSSLSPVRTVRPLMR